MNYINSSRPMHQSRLFFYTMIFYEQMRHRIETLAKGSAIATLFALPISTSGALGLFFLTTLLILLSGHWKTNFTLIKSNRIALTFLGFFFIYLLGSTRSLGSSADIKHQLLKFSWLLLTPLWIPLFIEDKWRQRAINAFLATMIVTLILAFIKYISWSHAQLFWQALNPRTYNASVFKDHIIQSFLMSMAAMIFLFRFIHQKRWGYALLFLLATIDTLFISNGRTGYIIFILLLTYTVFSQLNFKKSLMICSGGAVVLAILLVALPGAMHQRTHRALQDLQQWNKGKETTSLGYRMAWQINALKLVEKRPIIGYGTGSIKAAYASLPKQDTKQTGVVDNTSNEYLNVAVQFGLVGLLLFLGMLLMQWRYSFFLSKEQGLLIQVMLIGICVGNLANSWLMDFTQGHYFALMTMLAFAPLSKQPKPSTATDPACNDDAATDTPA